MTEASGAAGGEEVVSQLATELTRIGVPEKDAEAVEVSLGRDRGAAKFRNGFGDRWEGDAGHALAALASVPDGAGVGAFWDALNVFPPRRRAFTRWCYNWQWKGVWTWQGRVAAAAREGRYRVIDGRQLGYRGKQLDVLEGEVFTPDYDGFGHHSLCHITPDGSFRFRWTTWWPPRWVDVGNGELAVHHLFVRTRFPLSSIVEVDKRGMRPLLPVDLFLRGGETGPQYRFTLDPPAPVRYLGVLVLRQRSIRLVLPQDSALLHAAKGRARHVFSDGTIDAFVTEKTLKQITKLARRKRLPFKQAAIEFGIPERLYEDAAHLQEDDRNFQQVEEKFKALGY